LLEERRRVSGEGNLHWTSRDLGMPHEALITELHLYDRREGEVEGDGNADEVIESVGVGVTVQRIDDSADRELAVQSRSAGIDGWNRCGEEQ
jgi:hypothetical protein